MKKFDELVEIMQKLRSPGGCPWDLEQDHQSIKPYLLEEAHEVIEAIEDGDDAAFKEELGDLLLQVVFHAQLGAERKAFSIEDVVAGINQKMIRRHPHVFGNLDGVDTPQKVLRNWEAIKQEQEGKQSIIGGVPKALPALQRAWRIGEKASRAGFDWDDAQGVLAKVEEELQELVDEQKSGGSHERLEEEFGDFLFSLVSLARFLKVEPESALRRAIDKFSCRFGKIEDKLRQAGQKMKDKSLAELEEMWQEAKRQSPPTR